MIKRKISLKKIIYFLIIILVVAFFISLFQKGEEEGPVILNGNTNLMNELNNISGFRENTASYIVSLTEENGFKTTIDDIKSPTIETTYYGISVLNRIKFGKYNKNKLKELLNQNYYEEGYYKAKDADNPVKETFYAIKLSKLLEFGVNQTVNAWIKEKLKEEQSDENLYYLYCGLSEIEKVDKELINENLKNLKIVRKREEIEQIKEKSRLGNLIGYVKSLFTKEEAKEEIISSETIDYYLEGDATNERLYYVWKILGCIDEDKLDRSSLCLKYKRVDIATSRSLDSLFFRLKLIEGFCDMEQDKDKKLLILSKFYNPDKWSFSIKRGEHESIYSTYLGILLLNDMDALN